MTTPKERYDAAAAANHDALQALLNKRAAPAVDLAAELAQAKAANVALQASYDALLNGVADYLESATAQIVAAETPAAPAAVDPAPANPAAAPAVA